MSKVSGPIAKLTALVLVVVVSWLVAREAAKPAVSIVEISTNNNDYVVIRNNRWLAVDLAGYVFTDGDNEYVFPDDDSAILRRGDEGQIVKGAPDDPSEGDKGKKDFTGPTWKWTKWTLKDGKKKVWGLKSKGELVALLAPGRVRVVDFFVTGSMEEGKPSTRDQIPELDQIEILKVLLSVFLSVAVFAGYVGNYRDIWKWLKN